MSNPKKAAPIGSTALCPYLMVPSVEEQISFLVKTFDARITNETAGNDGFIQHGEVVIGDTNVMMGRASSQYPARQSMNFVYVENVDRVHKRLLENGATEIMSPEDRPYGMRESGTKDPFGNEWWIAELLHPTVSNDEQQLLNYAKNWDQAIAENDVERMKHYMSDDWVCVATNGGITSLEAFLKQIKTGELVHTEMSTHESRAKIYGATGIVTAKGYSKGTFRGNSFSFYEWSTSVFVSEQGTWRCVHTMLTDAEESC